MRAGWNENTLRWMCDASAYTGFHRDLAERLRAQMLSGGTLCDLGCGPGFIDFELAGDMSHITCIDQSAPALAFLQAQAAALGHNNLTAVCQDANMLSGTWDTIMSSFFGNASQACAWLPHARDRVVLVLANSAAPSFGNSHPRKHNTLIRAVNELEQANIHFHVQRATLEYGQPFASMQDADTFVRVYGTGEEDCFLYTNIQETGRADFPFYLPQPKPLGILTILRSENNA
ncbi:MAG: class I SAM-dependent methyltransferase [Oscillospiraceae bacterium]|nr:class I SAM-dependent methyltransferase [Oscillospiraceae bacterium]